VNLRISVENADWWYQGNSPRYWYASNLKVGDVIEDSFGKKIAEVTNISNYDLGGPFRIIYVDLMVKADYDKNKDQYLYEYKQLTVGSSVVLNFPREQLRGLVVNMGDEKIEYFYKTIKVEVRNVEISVADKVVKGLKSNDNNGNLLAEVIEVNNSIASYYEYSDIRGEKIKVYDPKYRDLEVTLKIRSFKGLDRNFYISNTVLKVGSIIWFQFPELALENTRISEIIN